MSIYRKDSTGTGEVSVKIESSGKYELQHGDRIALVSEVNIMYVQRIQPLRNPLCVYLGSPGTRYAHIRRLPGAKAPSRRRLAQRWVS